MGVRIASSAGPYTQQNLSLHSSHRNPSPWQDSSWRFQIICTFPHPNSRLPRDQKVNILFVLFTLVPTSDTPDKTAQKWWILRSHLRSALPEILP